MNTVLTQATQRAFGLTRRSARLGARLARRSSSEAFGLLARVQHLNPSPKPGMDDVTLARKVETELFRDPDSPKGSVDVNVADRVVYLHGEVKHPEQISELEREARRIPEVRDVENFLHLPKTPAPTRGDTPRSQQRSGTPRARPPRRPRPRTKPPEPSPRELAARREGRRPGPLGS